MSRDQPDGRVPGSKSDMGKGMTSGQFSSRYTSTNDRDTREWE
jgi:hypothetical protein